MPVLGEQIAIEFLTGRFFCLCRASSHECPWPAGRASRVTAALSKAPNLSAFGERPELTLGVSEELLADVCCPLPVLSRRGTLLWTWTSAMFVSSVAPADVSKVPVFSCLKKS